MPYTYPAAAPIVSGDAITANRFLNSPALVARRMRTILEQRFIAARILRQRFSVEGGAVVFETGETIYAADDPRPIAPLQEYPLTTTTTGTASVAPVVKIGEDEPISDEAIKRLKMQPVNRALLKLANTAVRKVDSTALSAIATAVSASQAATGSWSGAGTAAQILADAADVKADILALNMGYDPDVVLLDDVVYAAVLAKFIAAGFLPREAQNPVGTGNFPEILGMTWLPTPNLPTAGQAMVLDSNQLGGIGVEDLGGPGYTTVNDTGVQTKVIRQDEIDGYLARVRAVNVPVILEPGAAKKITGV